MGAHHQLATADRTEIPQLRKSAAQQLAGLSIQRPPARIAGAGLEAPPGRLGQQPQTRQQSHQQPESVATT